MKWLGSPASHHQYPDDDGHQQQDRQRGSHEAQFLTDDGENQVRVPGRNGAGPRLRLGTVEIPLSPEASAADGQQASGLLPALTLHIIVVVEQDDEAVEHILFGIRYQIKGYDASDDGPRRAEKQGEPPQGKACHEGHHHEDQQEHQRVAHIAGNNKVQSRYPQRMTSHIKGGGKGSQIPFFLPEPLELPGQQDDEGDLHHLRRADAHRQKGEFQPCGIAGIVADAKGRFQQQDKQHIERRDPLPSLDEHFQVDHGNAEIHHDADEQRRRLYDDLPVIVVVPGGAVDHGDAEHRRGAAKPQQDQVRLLDDLQYGLFQSLEHSCLLLSSGKKLLT